MYYKKDSIIKQSRDEYDFGSDDMERIGKVSVVMLL